jgi:hypothetical protein
MKNKNNLILILSFCCSAFGQTMEATTTDGRKVILNPDKTWSFKVEPQKTSQVLSKMPIPFTGDSLVKVTELAETLTNLKKSEFETEEQYKTKLRNLIRETKFGDKKIEEIVFVFDSGFRYNAENQKFNLSTIFIKIEDIMSVPNQKYGEYRIRLIGEKNDYGFSNLYRDFELKMLPDKAQEVKDNLRLAIYGFPVEVRAYKNADLDFAPLRYVVFNNKTGEIYLDQKETIFFGSKN